MVFKVKQCAEKDYDTYRKRQIAKAVKHKIDQSGRKMQIPDNFEKVLKNKTSKKQIVDNKRIKVILRNISKKSSAKKLDKKLTRMIWVGMIKAYINYEYRNFKKK